MEQIRLKQDIKRLWKVCFGDDDEFIHRFIDYSFANAYIHYAEEDGMVVAFLNLIPLTCTDGDQCCHGYYLYGVATDPDYRGKGISRMLLRDTLAKLNYDFVVTIPASESLFDFYRMQGFTEPMLRVARRLTLSLDVPANQLPEMLYPDDEARLFAELASANHDEGFNWLFPHYLYLFHEYERDNSSVRFFQNAAGDKKYMVFREEDQTIFILATNMQFAELSLACRSFDFGGDIFVYSAAGQSDESAIPYGLTLWSDGHMPQSPDHMLLRLAID